jgi:hypothetical protein
VQVTKKSNRQRKLADINASLDALLADQTAGTHLPDWALSHVARARKGRVLSLVAVKCGDCVCWERNEIRDCEITSCPLHAIRPYKGKTTAGPFAESA